MKTIRLTQGKVALVDDEDFAFVSRFRWRARRDKKTWYAETGSGSKSIFMHAILLGLDADEEGDHRDGDGLNNRRNNIRKATRSQNCMNRNGWSKHGFKGVYLVATNGRYGARIQVQKKMIQIGCFDTAEAAARAYDSAALKYHGEFARLNFLVPS